MSSCCSSTVFTSAGSAVLAVNRTIQAIVNLSQSVAALLGNPAAYNSTYAAAITNTIEFIKLDVAGLTSLTTVQRNEVINVLNQAEAINNSASAAGVITVQQINSILSLLELAVLKLRAFSFLTAIFPFLQRDCCGTSNLRSRCGCC
jgi:hypothetical protein